MVLEVVLCASLSRGGNCNEESARCLGLSSRWLEVVRRRWRSGFCKKKKELAVKFGHDLCSVDVNQLPDFW